jgi:hypothetical protein
MQISIGKSKLAIGVSSKNKGIGDD